jgi:hypothetical protein
MPEEFFDIAVINFEKYILYGRITVGMDEMGVTKERYIEQEMTKEQKEQLYELKHKHRAEMDRLLSSFVVR